MRIPGGFTAERTRQAALALGVVALIGVVLTQVAPAGPARDAGSLMVLFGIFPAVYFFGEALAAFRGPKAPSHRFRADHPFTPQLTIELRQQDGAPIPEGDYDVVFVLGELGAYEGFTARFRVTAGEAAVPAEFLKPEVALARFGPGTAFRILQGKAFVGEGKVLAQGAPPG